MTPPDQFPVIGVGASAGGIEALQGFFRGLPNRPGLALVIVTHLSPDRESLLHEIVSRYTDLPVHIAADDMAVENNSIYVLPADAILGIENRHLKIRKSAGHRARKPIDIFFSALALDLGALSGGIVLSGGDSDGTLGVKAIKEHGGITLAQIADGFGPQYPDMPESAISSGLIDFAVPVDEMGGKLAEFVQGTAMFDRLIAAPPGDAEKHTTEAALPQIYGILRNQIGHDFSGYKDKTFIRRLQRRMQVNRLTTIDAYVERLRQDPQEVGALFRDLLINVTNFFRDEAAFESLAKTVVPALFEGRGAGDTVRIWVPGCSTGEEAFSIGILVREHMDRLNAVPRVQIFATDIDEQALAVARAARYPEPLLDGVSPERRKRFFLADAGAFVVSKEVRELCIFSPHSVIRDPPFSHIDLVSCRNLLIYLGVDLQNLLIPTFHYALRSDGFLFLGSAENVSQFDDMFTAIDKRNRIFRRRSDGVPRVRLPILLPGMRHGGAPVPPPPRPPLAGLALRQEIDDQVLVRHAPPHVVINQDSDVVYYSARTGKYLEPAAGAPTRQLLTMARKGLRLDLRTLIKEAVESGRSARREGIAVESDEGRVQFVNLTIELLEHRAEGEHFYLVLFEDQGPVLNREDALNRSQAMRDGAAADAERELRATRERLQAMIEEYEAGLEELKSSNEELVSVNEEMQSANEELEASKEELQSVNEELHTVNGELSNKVEALNQANDDLQNLFQSTDVGTVFLDQNLVLRTFTPPVANVFNILSTDKGRPITDLSSRLRLPGFAADIKRVFAEGAVIERQAEHDDRQTKYLVRLAPYWNSEHKIEGVVVTFVDVTTLTRAESRQNMLIGELQHRTRNLLTLVQSIAMQTLGKGPAQDAFSARLAALGRVQRLVGGAIDNDVDLGDVVRLELQAVGAAEAKASVSGPRVPLGFDLVQTFALTLHELATNAVKHGALKEGPGRLTVSWKMAPGREDQPVLLLDWQERHVTMAKPSHKGFGRHIIERALSYTLNAKSELTFGKDGVTCHIEIPLPRPSAPAADPPGEKKA